MDEYSIEPAAPGGGWAMTPGVARGWMSSWPPAAGIPAPTILTPLGLVWVSALTWSKRCVMGIQAPQGQWMLTPGMLGSDRGGVQPHGPLEEAMPASNLEAPGKPAHPRGREPGHIPVPRDSAPGRLLLQPPRRPLRPNSG